MGILCSSVGSYPNVQPRLGAAVIVAVVVVAVLTELPDNARLIGFLLFAAVVFGALGVSYVREERRLP